MMLPRTLGLFLILAVPTAGAPAQDQFILHLSNGIAAIAEGEIITIQELRKELEPIIPRIRLETKNEDDFNRRIIELSREVLKNMIDRIIIEKTAEEQGLLIPPSYIEQEYDEAINRDFNGDRGKFLDFLSEQGKTPRSYRNEIYRRIAVNVMRQQSRKSKSEISPKRIEEFYFRNKIRFYQEETIRLGQIVLSPASDEGLPPLRRIAEKIISELKEGAAFTDLALQYGQKSPSLQNGDWSWIRQKDLRKELSQPVFGLEPGEYSDPIELNDTIFILYCKEKRGEIIQPITQVRDIIENILADEVIRENQERWIETLREKAYIRYHI